MRRVSTSSSLDSPDSLPPEQTRDLYVLIKGIKDELTADLKAARSEIADLATRVLRLENGALRVEKLEGAVSRLTDEIHEVLKRLIDAKNDALDAKNDALENTRQDLVTVQRQGDMEARLARRERMVGHAKSGAKWTAIATVGAIVLKIIEWWVTDKPPGLF